MEVVERLWADRYGGFLCRAIPHEHYAEFTVYTVLWLSEEDRPIFQKKDAMTSPEPTTDLSQAEVYLSGSVKWDGCSNLTFGDDSNYALHFCGKKEAIENTGNLIANVYDLAKDIIPTWDGDDKE